MIKIYPSTISGHLNAPASKSHAQRLLFMASMPAMPTHIKNVPICTDIDTTISCLESLGCEISRTPDGREVVVSPFPKTTALPSVELNFKESATTARLAIALCAALGIKANCKASGTLLKRKMVQLTGRLAIRGVTFTSFSLPFEMNGRMLPGEYIFQGDEGSQSISALMMFACGLLSDSKLILSSPLVDDSFIRLTRSAMESFGVKLEETEDGGYIIPGRQYYQSPESIETENDWGLSAMWILAAAACGARGKGLTVDNLPDASPQMYRDLQAINALMYQDVREINIDAGKCPNLATLYAAMAIVTGATLKLSGVPQLKLKECDRMKVMAEIARQFGQEAKVTDDGIIITGNGSPKYPTEPINTYGDPWVFMSMVLASAKATDPIILADEHGADKIYKNFLSDFEKLGGLFEIE